MGAGHRSWVREHAVQLDSDNVAGTDVDLLSGLDAFVEGKRFAFVGESNHFVHEKHAYRILLARYLVSRGFGVIGEELSWSDGLRVNRYLETGDESWLERARSLDGVDSSFDYEWDVVMMHGFMVKVRVDEQADAVFFQRRVSPLRT